MNKWRVDTAKVKMSVLLVCYTAGWTWIMGTVLQFALFFAADSRCNGDPPRTNMDGAWLVIATVCVWAAPFLATAVWRRSVVSVSAALISTVVGVAVVVDTFASPDAFCF
ncbi:hypothetical protein [Williamsia sp.]|uniref:hypothetical protein n=1 Tax=Williamsia sp. TaxID=1872085 RepID=UPI001A357815|nr:hypothetical protein [Williamsia sp.]MBJ7291543.1 hypothetical protein [Williamsia sp.]